MRLFIGLEIPSHLKKHIHDYLHPLQKTPKGWEKPHDYHQTLLFIGEANENDLEIIKERMKGLIFNPFNLTTDGFHFFNRRILYLDFEPSHDLLEMKMLVDKTFPEWVKETKPFVPHITVKRWQRYEYDELYLGLTTRILESMSFEVTNLSIFKSEKDSHNNKYHVIYRKNLNNTTNGV